MKKQIVLVSFVVILIAAPGMRAAINVLDRFRMGEDDPGAQPGAVSSVTMDSAGTKHLSLSGAPIYANDVASAATAHAGSTLSLDFASGNASGTNASLVSVVTDNLGIEAWAKPDTLSGSHFIAYNGDPGLNGWGLLQVSNTFQGILGGVAYVGSGPAALNQWTHVALVRANGVATLYVDGLASGTSTAPPNTPTGNFAVGAPPTAPSQDRWSGRLDEVRVFTFAPGQFHTNDLLLNVPPAALAVSPQFVPTWTPIMSLPIANASWSHAACSSNGARCIVSGRIYSINNVTPALYTSSNFGATWDPRTNLVGNVACSADGSVVLVAAQNTSFHFSTNFCSDWIDTGFINSGWVSVSGDGTKLALCGGTLRISTNSGASWYSSPIGSGPVAWSGDGTRLAVIHAGRVRMSTDNGANWTESGSPVNTFAWEALASSANGSVLAACSSREIDDEMPGNVYVSTDYGGSWSSSGAPGIWLSISVSGDGRKIAASSGVDSRFAYSTVLSSTDSGASWTPSLLPVGEIFQNVTLSADGAMMMTMNSYFGHPSYRYVFAQHDAPVLNIATAGGNASITWPFVTEGYVLQQNANLATTNWVTVTNAPAVVKQVILPATSPNNSYRLQKP